MSTLHCALHQAVFHSKSFKASRALNPNRGQRCKIYSATPGGLRPLLGGDLWFWHCDGGFGGDGFVKDKPLFLFLFLISPCV